MFIISNAKKGDINKILEIEKQSYTMPWDEAAFACELSKQDSNMNIFLTADDAESGSLAGYFVGNIITDYVHVLNIAVGEKWRRLGLARKFMEKAEQEAIKRGLGAMTLEVRENNEPALSLYKKLGYEIKGRRAKYYDNKHDGLLMWKKL